MLAELEADIPGVRFTSGYRTPDYQADMRRRGYNPHPNSGHLRGSDLDLLPPAGQSLAQLEADVRTRYPGARVLNHDGHVHAGFPGYDRAPAFGNAVAFGVRNPNLADRLPDLPDGFELDDPDMLDPDPDADALDSDPSPVGMEVFFLGGIVEQANGDYNELFRLARERGMNEQDALSFVDNERNRAASTDRVFSDIAEQSGGAAEPVTAGLSGDGVNSALGFGTRQLNAFNRGIPDILGAPVDLVNAGLRATGLPVSDRPVLGSEMIRDGAQALGWGLDTPEMAPRSDIERYTQSAARALGQNAIPGLGIIGAGGRVAAGGMSAANAGLRTGTALRSGTSVIAPTGAVNAGARQLALESARRPGVALAAEGGASVGQGTLGEYARQEYPDNPLVQTLAETAGAFAGGGLAGIAAYRSAPGAIDATPTPQNPAATSPRPVGGVTPVDAPAVAVRGSQGAADTPLRSEGVAAPQAMASDVDFPTIAADLPPLPPGFALDDSPMLTRGGLESSPASRVADIAQSIQPGDVTPIPANRVSSLAESEIANPDPRQLIAAPDERLQLSARSVGGSNRRGPLDLISYLRTRGGIRDDVRRENGIGDLEHMGIGNEPRDLDFARNEQFLGRLVDNENGMSLDEAAAAAWEAGYFPDSPARPSVDEFLEALDANHSGRLRSFLPDDLAEVDNYYSAQSDRFRIEEAAQEGRPLSHDPSEPVGLDDLDSNAPPLTAYEDLPERYGRVGNIDLSRIDTPQDIARALRTTQRAAGGFDAARRGVVSHEETSALASQLGMTADDLLKRRPGQALNAEQALAARRILAQSANELVNLARRTVGGSDEQLATFRRAWVRHAAIQEQVTGAIAEAGRTLSQFRMVADSRMAPQRILRAAIDGGGGRDGLEATAQRIIDLQRDPAQLNRFARDAANPSIGDKVWSLWYNSILSGPFTHLRNIIGNSVNVLMNVSEHGVASALGKVRGSVTGSNDRIVGREVSARLYGLMQGAVDGFGHGARAFRTGEAVDLTSKIELNQTTAFRGPASYVLEGPSRALLAEDEWFKSMARVSDIRGMAYRQAASEGLNGQDMIRRAEALVDNPTDEMMETAADYARELTFQEPLRGITEKIQGMRGIREGDSIGTMTARTALRLTIPFIRTPINLLRSALRRTPLGVVSNRNITDFRAGGAKRDLAIARVTVGTGVTALLFQLAQEGLLTGSGPQDWRERADLDASGWQRNSFRSGDTYQSFAGLDPFAITAGSIANMVENMDSYSDQEWSDMVPLMIFGVAENLTNQTWTSGLSDLLAAIRDPERNSDYYVARQVSSVVPAVVRQFNSSSFDTARRDTRGDGSLSDRVTGTLTAAIPGLSNSLPQRFDVLGRPVANEGALGPDAISPLFQRNVDAESDAIITEARRLGTTIGAPQRRVGDRRLTAAEFQDYQRVSGQFIREDITAAMTDPVWGQLNDAERRQEIDIIKRDARRDAREQLFPESPSLPPGFTLDR